MDTARVTTKGQVKTPRNVRKRFAIRPGNVLAFVGGEDGSLTVHKLSLPDVEAVQAELGATAAAEDVTEDDVYRWAREVRAERRTKGTGSAPQCASYGIRR